MSKSAPLPRPPRRVPCAACKRPIFDGARKCKHCKAWQPERARTPRAAAIVAAAVGSVLAVLITSRESPVGEAPPLTALPGDKPVASAGAPAAAPTAVPSARVAPPPRTSFKTRTIPMGDVHPLDLTFDQAGQSLFVSADDATIRQYLVTTGELVHKTSVPAKGDRVRLLFGRYLAVLRKDPRVARIPVVDVTKWDRDPILLDVGAGPGDILEMSDGTVVTATTAGHRVSRFGLPSGRLLADITLPQSTGQLFLVRAEGRPHLAAMGALTHAGRPAGAWIDVFDPEQVPFGATRRSIAVGRDPREGMVTSDGAALFFPDHLANSATFMRVAGTTQATRREVGQGPTAAFVLATDRWGITLNADARTASAVRLDAPEDAGDVLTLMLPGEPRVGTISPDRATLYVALGGTEELPRGRGLAVIAGDPPSVVATPETGAGPVAVCVSRDGARAAVANYVDKSITIVE